MDNKLAHEIAIKYTRLQAERVFQVLEFVKDWPVRDAAACLEQATWQVAFLADNDDTTMDELVVGLRKVADDTIAQIVSELDNE